MGNGLVLKFKGNKSFVAFSNLGDAEALTKTWKVCTKVAAHLEQGQRLENLSWRLWHLQNLLVESDNAKSKREFRKLSKHMGEKLDKEKGRSIEELSAPRFHRNQSSDKVRRLAEEKERIRERDTHATGHRLNRMQFTFAVDTPTSKESSPKAFKHHDHGSKDKKVDDSNVHGTAARDSSTDSDVQMDTSGTSDSFSSSNHDVFGNAFTTTASSANATIQPTSLRFPTLFSDDFAPTALLYPTGDFAPSLSYGEGVGMRDSFGVTRPTIEVPLDELLGRSSSPEDALWFGLDSITEAPNVKEEDSAAHAVGDAAKAPASFPSNINNNVAAAPEIDRAKTPKQQPVAAVAAKPAQAALSVTTKNLPISRGRRSSTTANSANSKLAATTVPTAVTQAAAARAAASSTTISAGGQAVTNSVSGKSECVNCGATHTPLWRRGLNDELNCNACGLYCKLHKRPRPKTMRQQHAETGRPSGNQKTESAESMGEPARCVNCHTMATPLWRKDDEGKTVCNACGLYFKLHNSNRPISMKSDVIRKRARNEQAMQQQAVLQHQRSISEVVSDTLSESPIASRNSSPERGDSPPPTATPSEAAAPDSAAPDLFDPAHAPFNFPADEFDFPGASSPAVSTSELTGIMNPFYGPHLPSTTSDDEHWRTPSAAVTQFSSYATSYGGGTSDTSFPGPFHPDYLRSLGVNIGEEKVRTGENPESVSNGNGGQVDRGNKRRRLSTESYQSSLSATEPPSSASSFFPLDNSSSASFSSIGLSVSGGKGNNNANNNSHRRSLSAPDGGGPEFASQHHSGVGEDEEDFPMNFLHPEREMMAAFLNSGMGGNEHTHGPIYGPPFGENPPAVGGPGTGNEDYMDVSMLFNAHY